MVDIILVLHCLPVTLSAVQQIHFSFLSILPVFDLDVVIGFCTVFGNIVCFGATMVQDVLFPLAGDTSVNDGGLSFLLNMYLDLLALLHICKALFGMPCPLFLGTWLEVYPC